MTEAIQKAETYRERAKQLRNIAQDLTDPERRSILLETAMHYEFMAKSAQRHDHPPPSGDGHLNEPAPS